MKIVWVSAVPYEKSKVVAALECGADAVVVPEGASKEAKSLGLIKTVAPDGDIIPGRDFVEVEIRGKEDELRAAREGAGKLVLVRCRDWTVIPLENLVAQCGSLIAAVSSREEATTALGVLEKGVAGVLLEIDDEAELRAAITECKKVASKVELVRARIVRTKPLGMGDRVCVDTCTNMTVGQGMLVGNASDAFFLVHSESVENPYVEPRPFRVNAGAVHAYVLVPDGKTRYLSELASGDSVLIVDHEGTAQEATVGRCKVERRPMLLVEAEYEGRRFGLVMQNAETIRLTRPDGSPASVVALSPGDEVLAHIERAGRHFGMAVEETIVER